MSTPAPEWTLADAQDWLRERVDHGDHCPCCTQFAKVYRRTIHATMARELIQLWRAVGEVGPWFHLPTIIGHGGDAAKCGVWGLLEEETEVRRDDGGRAGFWRVTPLGRAFVLGEARVPKYARIYDGRCLGLTGEPVGIRACLGQRFHYDELMTA